MSLFSLHCLALAFVVLCESKVFTPDFNRDLIFKERERGVTCHGELGCFDDDAPWNEPFWERLFSLEPETRDEIGTEFRYYAPGKNVEIIKNSNFDDHKNSLLRGFDTSINIKFVIHGYMGGDAPWALELKDAFQRKERCNVILVDWSEGDGFLYEQAVANTRIVGAELGLFIQRLKDILDIDLSKIHIIGHSLGAHTSGYAGKWVKDKLNAKVGRITGMDPAGPYFNNVALVVRLDMKDAEFVDIIHTNYADNRMAGFGLEEPIGHFDFYPNGGEDQPGCKTALQAELSIGGEILQYLNFFSAAAKVVSGGTDDTAKAVDGLSCSHGRAYEFFIASIEQADSSDCHFKANACWKWEAYELGKCDRTMSAEMGYNADKYKHLVKPDRHIKFYLRTTDRKPFCKK